MPTDAELTYADHMGRFYARRYSFPPMVGRLIGYLSVADPPAQTINELSDALLASRSAIAGAAKMLEVQGTLRRTRAAGDRMDRVELDLNRSLGMDTAEYEEMRELAHEGLAVIADASFERRQRLLEMAAFMDFLVDHMERMKEEWEARRAALVDAGELLPRPDLGSR